MPNKKKVVWFRKVLHHEATNTMPSICTRWIKCYLIRGFPRLSQTSLNNPTVPIDIPGEGHLRTLKSYMCFVEEPSATILVCAWTGVYRMVSNVNLTSNLLRVSYHWSSLLLYNTLHVNSAKTIRVTKREISQISDWQGFKAILTVMHTHAGGLAWTWQKHAVANNRAPTLDQRNPFRDAYIPKENSSPYEWEVIYGPHHTLDEPLAWPACKLYSFVQWECWVKWRSQYPCKPTSAESRANCKRGQITAQT